MFDFSATGVPTGCAVEADEAATDPQPCRQVWVLRAGRVLHRRIEFVPHPMFDEPNAGELVERLRPPPDRDVDQWEPQRESAGGDWVRALCCAPPLSADQERFLFCRMNFVKSIAIRLRRRLSVRTPQWNRLSRIETCLDEALNRRNRLIESNLRLAVSLVRQTVPAGTVFDELVGEAMVPLFRAAERFDFAQGTRFSTYATRAIRNHLLRVRKREARHFKRAAACPPELLNRLPDARVIDPAASWQETCSRRAVRRLLSRLEQRDQLILAARHGLCGFRRGHTFGEIAELVGLSKERTRVLTHRAHERLRESLQES